MAHQRKLIRDNRVAALKNATAAGMRVFPTRLDPLKPTELPAISVYTLSEETDEASADTAPREIKRTLELEVRLWVAHSDGVHLDDAVDALAEQVEAVMDADRYFGGTVSDSYLKKVEMEVDEDTDPLIGVARMFYAATYRTSPAAPGGLDDFKTVDAKYQLVGGVADTVPAEDTFTVQETTP
jgi:hypothetical protein